MGNKKINISLIKHVEYFDGENWRPIIWYSNRNDSEFEQMFDGPDIIEHSDLFYNSFDEFSSLIKMSELEKRGLPDDLSDYMREKITSRPGSFYGASYYYLNELKDLISHEEEILVGELKNGVEIKLFDDSDNIKKLLDGSDLSYNEETKKEGQKTVKVIRLLARTVDQLKYIANIVTKFVYEIHGFVEDDKIRVIFYYKK